MKSRKTLMIIMAIGLISVSYHSFAQTAEELLPKAIQFEEVKGNLDEAIKAYQMILKKYPENREVCAEAMLHLGMCFEKLGLDQARQTYRDVISKYSEQADKVTMARDRISRLDAYTAELIAKAEEYFKKGNELFKRWEYESAIKEYENAIKSGPNTQLALNASYCIGQSWYRAGKYDAALATLTKLVEENPKSNIAPVAELMVAQVQYAMDNNKNPGVLKNYTDEGTIIDPETGIKYTKIKSFVGKNDLISGTSGGFNFSPDGQFMVQENQVVPVDGSDAFNLVEIEALRAVYAPGMRKAAFYADSAIWTVPVSPETGRSIGQPEKLLAGNYRYQNIVSWSPDGEKIAFAREDKTIAGDIWTISVTDRKLMPVTNSPGHEGALAWSPDGKTIAYKKDSGIWLASLKGEEAKMIIENGGIPHWSMDGKWLFHSNWENNHLYSFDQNLNFKLTPPKQVGNFASFSPDGKKVLFYRGSSDIKWPLKIVSASGGPSFTPESIGVAYGSQWVGDSRSILTQSENENSDILLKIIPLTGGIPVKVNIDVAINGKPFPFLFSDDLTKVAFSVRRDNGLKDLYIAPFSMAEARTTGPARLVFEGWSGGAYNVLISWSHDGKKLAVVHEGDIWVVPLEGGKPVQITNTPEPERWIDFSPDGNMISYIIPSTQAAILHVIPAVDGISKVVNNSCKANKWSPDSKSIVLLSNNELQVVSLAGEKLKHIVNTKDIGIDELSDLQYSPNGKYLAFIGYNGDESLILTYSFESSKITRLAFENLNDYKYSLEWSPDGKWLSYLTYEEVKVRPESSLWEADFKEVLEKLAK